MCIATMRVYSVCHMHGRLMDQHPTSQTRRLGLGLGLGSGLLMDQHPASRTRHRITIPSNRITMLKRVMPTPSCHRLFDCPGAAVVNYSIGDYPTGIEWIELFNCVADPYMACMI